MRRIRKEYFIACQHTASAKPKAIYYQNNINIFPNITFFPLIHILFPNY